MAATTDSPFKLPWFTPKIKRKFFDFYILWIKTNVAYTRLEMIARTKYCTTTTASNWFVTLYYKLLPAVRSPSKHGRWRSSLLLYSISMVIWEQCNRSGRIWMCACLLLQVVNEFLLNVNTQIPILRIDSLKRFSTSLLFPFIYRLSGLYFSIHIYLQNHYCTISWFMCKLKPFPISY